MNENWTNDTNLPKDWLALLQVRTLNSYQTLAAAIDAEDAYTRGHSQRVAVFAANLAKQAGLSRAQIDVVFRAGTIHDIGKIMIPPEILKKPTDLTDEEHLVMAQHPVLGEHLVRELGGAEELLPGVRSHHEAYDGSGYPDGLVGESIPLIARVLTLADTFDAMTSDRPYRPGLTVEEAITVILRESGRQFDPELGPIFADMMANSRQKAA
ncbi:MAG TPA: HD-GYP domain-containing protein [Fimbriimonadaceae bacterium]|nr:HD-GYP domain-containing protein [Fimbriimonadaceae bacterium]